MTQPCARRFKLRLNVSLLALGCGIPWLYSQGPHERMTLLNNVMILPIEGKQKMKKCQSHGKAKEKLAHQKKGPLNLNISTPSHNYGHKMLYPVIYKPHFDFVMTDDGHGPNFG